jgi:hypothetical protein
MSVLVTTRSDGLPDDDDDTAYSRCSVDGRRLCQRPDGAMSSGDRLATCASVRESPWGRPA